ncbi:MAG: rod shape-determining protein RodA [Bacteroidaceae bacterium]|nr:rod shape-determining protein RodA [Bacteroidaceae bacterium]
MEREKDNILRSLDWTTIVLYLMLGTMGWLAICGASYSYIETNIWEFFALSERTGKQAMWIGISIIAGMVLMFIDKRSYEFSSRFVYAALILLGILTIFISKDIKGSRSWITIGSFGIQPAEFMKFGTTLALASIMNKYGFSLNNRSDFLKCLAITMLPLIIIICQKETGSALVYLSFFIVLYREGMTGMVLLTAISAVVYFVVGIGYENVFFDELPVSVGHYAVIALIQIFAIGMTAFWCKEIKTALVLLGINVTVSLITYWIAIYLFSFNILYVQYLLLLFDIIYLLVRARIDKQKMLVWTTLFIVVSTMFFHSCNYVFNNVMKPHQKVRIEVLLGLKEDLAGAGYNVHQSKIAIGSGGFFGKGFLNGTQTKLKYVPEQDTDFIFCTIGEEQGFVGSTFVLVVFIIFVLRLLMLAERQNDTFGRVYGYSLVSIFFFHFFINIGMVLGITPVIGIPLPFFSYGGSSFLGFSILLFSFLRIDADRDRRL